MTDIIAGRAADLACGVLMSLSPSGARAGDEIGGPADRAGH
jgi:hypothetical protein